MTITVALKNQSTVVTDAELVKTAAALQIQLDRDWLPLWNSTAKLITLNKTAAIPAGAWPIYILDTSDVQGALGYHDDSHGTPYGRVFAKTARDAGYSWTVTLSHELVELMGNPWVNRTVLRTGAGNTGTLYMMETGDPVEADALGYQINGIQVSDFVTPQWFDVNATARGTRYDYTSHCTAPFQILGGGYMSVMRLPGPLGWSSINAQNVIQPSGSDRDRMWR
jgi:hypothetical protein